MFKKLRNMFKKEEEHVQLPEKPGCSMCRLVKTAGRSGEKEVQFLDKSKVKVEIINESNIEGRGCYTLNILNDPNIGWADVPIRCCPYCGCALMRGQKKC